MLSYVLAVKTTLFYKGQDFSSVWLAKLATVGRPGLKPLSIFCHNTELPQSVFFIELPRKYVLNLAELSSVDDFLRDCRRNADTAEDKTSGQFFRVVMLIPDLLPSLTEMRELFSVLSSLLSQMSR